MAQRTHLTHTSMLSHYTSADSRHGVRRVRVAHMVPVRIFGDSGYGEDPHGVPMRVVSTPYEWYYEPVPQSEREWFRLVKVRALSARFGERGRQAYTRIVGASRG